MTQQIRTKVAQTSYSDFTVSSRAHTKFRRQTVVVVVVVVLVFFDLCCLPQKRILRDVNGEFVGLERRTEAEEKTFKSALDNMHVLYTHRLSQ